MRTIIDIDGALLQAVKARAADERRTLEETFEQALRDYLSGPSGTSTGVPRLPTFRGEGMQPSIDLASNAALRAIMDEEP